MDIKRLAQVSITGNVPEDLLAEFMQHIRDFDASHDGCHFKIAAMTEQGTRQVKEWLSKLDPPFPGVEIFHKS